VHRFGRVRFPALIRRSPEGEMPPYRNRYYRESPSRTEP
jgi:hypothetical protein